MAVTLNNKFDVLSYARTGKFVIYGAGQVGITLLRYLTANDSIDSVLNFAVTGTPGETEEIMGVPVYGAAKLPANSRVLIAVHPKSHDEITSTLTEYAISDITGISWDCYLQIRRTIHDFSTEQLLGQRRLNLNHINRMLEELVSQPEIVATNTAAFGEYENAFEGRDVVLLGTGPSLNKYKPIKGAIHIGVKRAYKFEKVKLDFLFASDFNRYIIAEMYGETGFQCYIDDLRKLDCKKFIGVLLRQTPIQLSEKYFKEIKATKYFAQTVPTTRNGRMYRDIRYHPLKEWMSVIFSAMSFALWGHPKRIFIVGCDGQKPDKLEYFNEHKEYKGKWLPPGYTSLNNFIYVHHVAHMEGWEEVKKFAEIYYSDVEIISINPGFLKGLFKDTEM